MFDLLSGTSTQIGQHDGPIKCVRWFDMPQGGILATGSWDKTLKVRVHQISPPDSIRPSFPLFFFLSTWSLTLGNATPNQVLGPPIAHSTGYGATKRKVLRHGCEEQGARSRDRGPTYPDIRPLEPANTLQSWLLVRAAVFWIFGSLRNPLCAYFW